MLRVNGLYTQPSKVLYNILSTFHEIFLFLMHNCTYKRYFIFYNNKERSLYKLTMKKLWYQETQLNV
jgi:hypothetical protein